MLDIWKRNGEEDMKKVKIYSEDRQLTKLGDKYYSQMFKAIQLVVLTVVYYNFNYDKKSIQELNDELHEMNKIMLDDHNVFEEAENTLIKKYNFDCEHEASIFPFRTLTAMMGGIPKKGGMRSINVAKVAAQTALESYLVLFLKVFLKREKLRSESELRSFWKNVIENGSNYAKGMDNNFVIEYFIDQIDLAIKED